MAYQVLEYLKADTTPGNIPVVMIAAVDEIDRVARCIHLGAEDYLTKPFNAVLLRARVDACLEKRGCATKRRCTRSGSKARSHAVSVIRRRSGLSRRG